MLDVVSTRASISRKNLTAYCLAFVVAWGGMTAQAASLLCSSILCLELKRDHHQRWEQTFLWAVMLIGLGQ